jgi:fructokinase
VGIDLGGTKIEGVVLDAAGREAARERVPTPRPAGNDAPALAAGYAAIVAAIVDMVARLEARTGHADTIGVGAPGSASPTDGLMRNCNATCVNGRPLARDLADALGRDISLANDANCFALSEAVDGAGAGARTVFGVILGTGVGGGIVVDGHALVGANAIAGEWGHNPLPWPARDEHPGPACFCGRRGCLETFVSGPGLARDHQRVTGEPASPAEIAAAAAAGDATAIATLDRHAHRLARGLAAVINLLDPDVIVLGGGVSRLEHLYTAVPGHWGAFVACAHVRTQLRPARHGDASGVRGAAWLQSTAAGPPMRDRAPDTGRKPES